MALGKLVVTLSANITEFSSAMDKAAFQADKSMTGITRSVGLAGVALATFAFQAGQALRDSAINAINFADEVDKAATKAGIAATTMAELAVAAGTVDVDIKSLSDSLRKLQINLSKAATGGKEQKESLAALGLTIEDLADLGADRQLEVIAEQISKLEDPADRARAAYELLGKSAGNLLPLFDQGAEGIRRAREEAIRTGAALTQDQIDAGVRLDDSIKRLGASWRGFTSTLVTAVEPAANFVFSALQRAFTPPSPEGMIRTYEVMLASLEGASDKSENSEYRRIERRLAAARREVAERERIAKELASKTAAATEGRTPVGFEDEDKKRERERREKEAQTAINRIINERKSIVDGLEQTYLRMLITAEEMAILELSRKGSSAEEIARAQALADAIRDRRVEEEALKTAQAESKRIEDERKATLESWPDLWFNAATAAEQYALEIEKLNELATKLIAAGVEQGKVNEYVARTQDQISKKYDEASRVAVEFGEAISSSFESAILQGKGLQDILKGILQDILAIIIRAKVTTPLGNAITGALGGGGGTGILESIFGAIFGSVSGGAGGTGSVPTRGVTAPLPSSFSPPGRVFGGSVMAGNAYLVGEAGPEIFVPQMPGEVLNGQFGGGGGRRVNVVNQTFNISTPNADSFRLSQRQLSRRARIGINV